MVEIFSLEISILDIWLWKVVPSKLFSKLWNGQISTIINTSSKLVDICSRSSRIRKVLDSEVAIYLFQIFKCFCCWHASLLPKRWEGSKTHHTLLMTLYGGLCIRAHSKFEFQTRHSNIDTYFQISYNHSFPRRLGVIQQLRGQNFAIVDPTTTWTVFIPWAWTKTDIFLNSLPPHLVHVVIECPLT